MQFQAGTSGYSYKEWRGAFYPEDLASEDMLAHYATRLPVVEINNTFYRMPKSSVLENWAQAVPSEFRFYIKATRRITHQRKLADVDEPVAFLIRAAETLGEKLGGVLFQLPPFLRADQARLAAFLDLWPRDLPAAMEFRHASWFCPETFEALSEHGVALVVSEDEKLAPPDRLDTTDWLYLRLRRSDYTTQDLRRWAKRAEATGAERCVAFFKHEDDAGGPELANRFAELANKPAPKRAPRVRDKANDKTRDKAKDAAPARAVATGRRKAAQADAKAAAAKRAAGKRPARAAAKAAPKKSKPQRGKSAS